MRTTLLLLILLLILSCICTCAAAAERMPLPVPRVGGYATEATGKGRRDNGKWNNGEFTTTTPSLSMSESMSASATLPLSDTTTVAPPAADQQEGSSE
ncbi:uncharacterized protein TM35_000611070, partial [Trypanosoma theileri]